MGQEARSRAVWVNIRGSRCVLRRVMPTGELPTEMDMRAALEKKMKKLAVEGEDGPGDESGSESEGGESEVKKHRSRGNVQAMAVLCSVDVYRYAWRCRR